MRREFSAIIDQMSDGLSLSVCVWFHNMLLNLKS